MNKQEILKKVLDHIEGDRTEYNPQLYWSCLLGLVLRCTMMRGRKVASAVDLTFQIASLKSPSVWIGQQLREFGFSQEEAEELAQLMPYDLAVYYLKGKVYGEAYGWTEYDCYELSDVYALEMD